MLYQDTCDMGNQRIKKDIKCKQSRFEAEIQTIKNRMRRFLKDF